MPQAPPRHPLLRHRPARVTRYLLEFEYFSGAQVPGAPVAVATPPHAHELAHELEWLYTMPVVQKCRRQNKSKEEWRAIKRI